MLIKFDTKMLAILALTAACRNIRGKSMSLGGDGERLCCSCTSRSGHTSQPANEQCAEFLTRPFPYPKCHTMPKGQNKTMAKIVWSTQPNCR